MRLSNKATVIYDIGNGIRVIAVIVFVGCGVLPLVLFIRGARELADMPRFVWQHPGEGTVAAAGAILAFWCVGLFLWRPIRVLVLPIRDTGTFAGYGLSEDANGRRLLVIAGDKLRLICAHNDLLEGALKELQTGERIRVLRGSRRIVTKIEKI